MKVLIIVLILILVASVYVVTLATNAYAIGIEVRNQEGKLVISNPESSNTHNTFELGVWAFPILATNLILLLLGILYYKKRLPSIIKKSINFIFDFEVSRKIAFIVVVSLLVIYVGFSISDIEHSNVDESSGDYQGVKKTAANWTGINFEHGINAGFRYLLLSISLNVFGNIRIMPFVVSTSLLVLTYYTTVEISKKRFAGIISMVVLLQSHLFLEYRSTATYENSWIFFYLLSLYLINKKWYLSPISYILSLFSKPLVAIFLPLTFFFIYRSVVSKKTKMWAGISYMIITVIVVTAILIGYSNVGVLGIHTKEFWTGFAALETFLRFDGLVLVFLLPLIIGLFITSRRGILQADSLMVLIMGVLLSAPLLAGFTDITNQPYRFVPLVVFFAIGVGTLLSNKINGPVQTKKNHVSVAVFLITLITVLISLTLVILPALIVRYYRLSL